MSARQAEGAFVPFHCLNCDRRGIVREGADRIRCNFCDARHFIDANYWREYRARDDRIVASLAIDDLVAGHGTPREKNKIPQGRAGRFRPKPDRAGSAPASGPGGTKFRKTRERENEMTEYEVQAQRPNPYHGENDLTYTLSAVAPGSEQGDTVPLRFVQEDADAICKILNGAEPDTWHVVALDG